MIGIGNAKKKPKMIALSLCKDGDCLSLNLNELKQNIEATLKGRGNAVMTRLRDEDLDKLDALVETELFKSRSEVAAYFIQEGINSNKDLFEKVMPKIEKIKQLKEEIKKSN